MEHGTGRHGQGRRLAVAIERASPQAAPLWRRQLLEWSLLEWSLLAGVMVVLVVMLGRQVRVVQAQGELAAIKSTLGALRTALVIEHLQKSLATADAAVVSSPTNPFELLQRRPANYLGEMNQERARDAPPGSWVFDPGCGCVGYLPLYARWFESSSGDSLVWFRLIGAPGPWQLAAKESYTWQGTALD